MKKVMFLNHESVQCGVYQYGKRVFSILSKDNRYSEVVYQEVSNEDDYFKSLETHQPDIVIVNWHPDTIPWWSQNSSINTNCMKIAILHENGTPNFGFDKFLNSDMSSNFLENKFSLRRPLPHADPFIEKRNDTVTIGSFGFGFSNKGFEKICNRVVNEIDNGVIKLHIPKAFYGDSDGSMARSVMDRCLDICDGTNISIEISTNFMSDIELIHFLNQNDINMFLYDEMPERGLASTMDFAIAAMKPFAISNSAMFRHISARHPELVTLSIKEIIALGISPTLDLMDIWDAQGLQNDVWDAINS